MDISLPDMIKCSCRRNRQTAGNGGVDHDGTRSGRMNRITALIAAAALCFSCFSVLAESAAPSVLIQAHRGASYLAPENTLSAFRAAYALGADGIETDIRMTRDRQLVLRHEDAIDLTSSGHGNISEMTLEELKRLDFGAWYGEEFAGETIPSFDEFLEAAKEWDFQVLNLEMKPLASDTRLFVQLTADAILRSGLGDKVTVSSFDARLLKEMKRYAPSIPVALLTVPNLSAISLFRLSDYFPQEKPLSEYTLDDVKKVPAAVSVILRGFGAKGNTPAGIVLDVIKGVAAVVPEGSSWTDAEQLIREQANLIKYVDSLDFQIDYLNCHYSTLTGKLIAAMHERGIGVNVWTPDTERDLEKVLALKPDGIITNQPENALRIRDQKERE